MNKNRYKVNVCQKKENKIENERKATTVRWYERKMKIT